ncbi:dihydroorotate dehydrogenase electron transfer subunit [Desulfurispira natronophila]|uniref:Dihydroorotate dehydrogenase B (NAD(+)), electron transfer subunit n=1 Tax=Desulfurispira natronophila TaxID=682562 RepID=A0A7W7Y417_9BACT|nr:dihydroorotate dehydrogenase electron transfer subunit [Desulfurispira natronophila]MBB5021685.1 dihydroorotate dehydrogenase electron transfer subunit [Desulfurispira natronophila]
MTTYSILRNQSIGGGNYLMEVSLPPGTHVHPGQFCMLQANVSGYDPLLKRPISIADKTEKSMLFAYKVVGRGTEIMSHFVTGQNIDILGPLGNGFELHQGQALLVGGGIGIAPLLLLARELKAAGVTCQAIIGAATANDLIFTRELGDICDDLVITTDDGSLGRQGFVTAAMEGKELTHTHIYCCGPDPMMRQVAKLGAKALSCQLSLETHMACGIGVCLGCVTETQDELGNVNRRTVCKEGPVFTDNQITGGLPAT